METKAPLTEKINGSLAEINGVQTLYTAITKV